MDVLKLLKAKLKQVEECNWFCALEFLNFKDLFLITTCELAKVMFDDFLCY